ncbi:helix-turn-helix transcriptional regulator [Priestia megaterium]|jgi:DNA-binding XRE family transcriptional regulator|uniref:helix-turn-helix transcriptional regulator n=1 Tax=Priestia megaterium TaxID=1404 RepID=UPI00399CE988
MGNKPLNLRKARKKKDLTQEELAEKLGISRIVYLKIENGKQDPKMSLAREISKFFDETIDYLFEVEVETNEDRAFSFMQDYFNRKARSNEIRATM